MNRRNWLRTAAGILVAPAVVRAESIMRVRPVLEPMRMEICGPIRAIDIPALFGNEKQPVELYFDANAAPGGDGSRLRPFRSIAGARGNVYYFKGQFHT